MKKIVKLNEADIRNLVQQLMNEDMETPTQHPSAPTGRKPPPLPTKQKSGGPPNLKVFKADCNMMADAAQRVKDILDAGQGNTKEAIRWLDKVIQFASSAKKIIGS